MDNLINDLKVKLYDNAGLSDVNLLRKARALHSAIPLIAQTLVENSATKIHVKRHMGPGGCTDGKTIWLMDGVLPVSSKDVPRYVVYVALKIGLVHHEIGHVNATDFTINRRSIEPLANHILGIIEDVRQENVHIRANRSGRKYLDALSIATILLGLNMPVTESDTSASVITAFLLYSLRHRFRHEPHFMELAEGARTEMLNRFGRSVVVRLEAEFSRMTSLKSTADAVQLSEDLAFLLREEQKKADQKKQRHQQLQQQLQSSAASTGVPDDGCNVEDAETDQQNGQEGDGSSDSSIQAGDVSPSDSSNGAAAAAQQAGNADDPQAVSADDGEIDDVDPDVAAKSFKDLLDDDLSSVTGDLDEKVRKKISDLNGQIKQSDPCETDEVDMQSILAGLPESTTTLKLSSGNGELKEATSAVARLSGHLKKKLQAQSIVSSSRSATGTRVIPKRLSMVPAGDPRIFRKTTGGIDTNVAVFLLGDVSSSMHGEAITVSNQALFATAMALQRITGVDVAVGAFPGKQVVLRFGERARLNEKRFNLQAHDCTPLHEGVLMAHMALRHSRRARKILIVCTDGEPDSLTQSLAALDHVVDCGIEVFGIGIKTDSVCNLFKNWAMVNSVHDLPKAMLTALSGSLGIHLGAAA